MKPVPIPVRLDGRWARVLVVGGGDRAAGQGANALERRAYASDDVAWATLIFAVDDDDAWRAIERGTFAWRLSSWR